mmetsp:Transcript_19291/g.28566  ORF Transcript_19291/g.28566 Transcript_19291/m.28566 type:complete len:82 (+) Transcript_19291:4190-4435(+)
MYSMGVSVPVKRCTLHIVTVVCSMPSIFIKAAIVLQISTGGQRGQQREGPMVVLGAYNHEFKMRPGQACHSKSCHESIKDV